MALGCFSGCSSPSLGLGVLICTGRIHYEVPGGLRSGRCCSLEASPVASWQVSGPAEPGGRIQNSAPHPTGSWPTLFRTWGFKCEFFPPRGVVP